MQRCVYNNGQLLFVLPLNRAYSQLNNKYLAHLYTHTELTDALGVGCESEECMPAKHNYWMEVSEDQGLLILAVHLDKCLRM